MGYFFLKSVEGWGGGMQRSDVFWEYWWVKTGIYQREGGNWGINLEGWGDLSLPNKRMGERKIYC